MRRVQKELPTPHVPHDDFVPHRARQHGIVRRKFHLATAYCTVCTRRAQNVSVHHLHNRGGIINGPPDRGIRTGKDHVTLCASEWSERVSTLPRFTRPRVAPNRPYHMVCPTSRKPRRPAKLTPEQSDKDQGNAQTRRRSGLFSRACRGHPPHWPVPWRASYRTTGVG